MLGRRRAIALGLLTVWLVAGVGFPSAAERHAAASRGNVSLDFTQADIRDVLRVLAEVSGMNSLAGPEVRGTVTAKLTHVTWEQVLDQAEAQARQVEKQTGPQVTRLVPVKYRDAAELQAAIAQHLGACASISVDRRTNTLIHTGTPSCLQRR